MADKVVRFWETKKLGEMSQSEWEALCDGCGLCCLQKLQDDGSEAVYYTRIACRLLDVNSCLCKHYADRKSIVPDCIQLTPNNVGAFRWLPPTCAYKCLASGEPLPDWHPLLTGDYKAVHRNGISMKGRMLSEESVCEGDWENYLIFRIDE